MVKTKRIKHGFYSCTLFFLLTACSSHTAYNIRVNGYKNADAIIFKPRSIYVLENTLEPNPLLAKEVSTKIEKYLMSEGYKLANDFSTSDYVLSFAFAIDSGITKSYSGSFSTTSYRLNTYTNKFELVPNIHSYSGSFTSFTRYLVLVLLDTKELLKSQEAVPIWIAEVSSSGSSSDLRKVLDYLLVAAFEYYGENTNGIQQLSITENDVRVRKLY